MISLFDQVPTRGLLSMLGAFLIQFGAGGFHGTFGNMLPYLTSYMRQFNSDLTNGDLATVFSTGGTFQGFTALIGGLVVVPVLGPRRSLVAACCLYSLAPVLGWLVLGAASPDLLALTYGLLSAVTVNFILLLTFTIPATWFPPEHRGKVTGFVNGGFGLSPTVFSPLQSLLVNPANLAPGNTSQDTRYFTEPAVLDNVPPTFLYMSAIYAAIFAVGICLAVEKPRGDTADTEAERESLREKLRRAFTYFKEETLTRRDFYLLWISRFFYLICAASALSHWKAYSYTRNADDKLVSITGGLGGVFSFLSRVMFGVLLDRIPFNRLMPAISLLLALVLASLYFIGQHSFAGIIVCVWCVFMLAFANFSTIPAQALLLFPGPNCNIVVGSILLAESFAFMCLGLMNKLLMSTEDGRMYLTFFLVLAACSLVTVLTTWFVSTPPPADKHKHCQTQMS